MRKIIGASALFFAIHSIQTFAGFSDSELKTWLSTNHAQDSLMPAVKEVVVFFKAPQSQTISFAESRFENFHFTDSLAQSLKVKDYQVLWSSNAAVMKLDRAALKKLMKNPAVEGVYSNGVITLDEPPAKKTKNKTDETQMTYGLQRINIPAAWEMGARGKDMTVGVIDTGVDAEHPDLKGKIALAKDFTADNDNKDYHGHGTHVCGTIVGGSASGTQIGVAPDAKIVMAKVFDSKGSTRVATLLSAMEFMLDPDGDPLTKDQPRVVSNSWGSGTQFSYAFRKVIQNWRLSQIFPSFAAGNSGFYLTIASPGSYPYSFAVGAIDENLDITSFSSRGPTVWMKKKLPHFLTKPNVAAPGLNVWSSLPGGTWGEFSGTSMATPHLSGVVALAYSVNPHLSVEKLMEILETSTLDRGHEGMDNRYGHGIIQADQVVQKAKACLSDASCSQVKALNLSEWDSQ